MASYQATLTLQLPNPTDQVVKRSLTITEFAGKTSLGPYSIAVDATTFAVPDALPDTVGAVTFVLTDTNQVGLSASTSVSGTVPAPAQPPADPAFTIAFSLIPPTTSS